MVLIWNCLLEEQDLVGLVGVMRYDDNNSTFSLHGNNDDTYTINDILE